MTERPYSYRTAYYSYFSIRVRSRRCWGTGGSRGVTAPRIGQRRRDDVAKKHHTLRERTMLQDSFHLVSLPGFVQGFAQPGEQGSGIFYERYFSVVSAYYICLHRKVKLPV